MQVLFGTQAWDAIANDVVGSSSSSLMVSQHYRGQKLANISANQGIDLSIYGLTVGGAYHRLEGRSDVTTGFLSYSSQGEEFVTHFGFGHVNNIGPADGVEFFAELTGRQSLLGFRPSIFGAWVLEDQNRQYFEARVARTFVAEQDILIDPFVEVSWGNYYSSERQLTHTAIGFDVAIPITRTVDFSPSFMIVVPFDGVKDFDAGARTSVQVGVNITFRF